MEVTYKKSKGNAGLDGVQFQIKLLAVILLNALRNLKNWRISTENQNAAKFDDIVVELTDGSALLFQVKFKDNRKITKDQLLSVNSKNADFSLPKYFFSYREVQAKFTAVTAIICTNTNVGVEEGLGTRQCVSPDSLLYQKSGNCSLLKFNKSILPALKTNAAIYFDKNLQVKGIDKSVITDDNLEDFLNNFQLVCDYPCGADLDKVIEESLAGLVKNVSPQELYRKLEDWFKQRRGEYLTELRADAMFCEIKSDKYCETLKDYEVCFERNNFSFPGQRGIIHVVSNGGHLLQTLKIYHALKDDQNIKLYVCPNDDIEVQKQAVESFKLPKYTLLVIVWHTVPKESVTAEINLQLRDILKNVEYKKVILVAKDIGQIGLEDVLVVDGSVAFEDFTEEIRKRFMKKYVIFQGESISLEQLLTTSTASECEKAINSIMLEKLVKGDEIKLGTRPLGLEENTARYYIDRTFEREICGSLKEKETFTEYHILDVKEKVVLIADSAGMGKSTVLANMTTIIKQKHPQMWVVRIELNDYTKLLRDYLRKKKDTIQLTELLATTELTNDSERDVFSIKEKVVLMLDGLDEISPDYTKLVLGLVSQCQVAPNIAKVIVTTRPHMTQELKATVKVTPYTLHPFTEQNQVSFLTRYWAHNLQLVTDVDKGKCEKFAEALINKMALWTMVHRGNHFTAIPLQVRMLAEIFQETVGTNDSVAWQGCAEFLNGTETEPRLPEKVNITNLYAMFVEKKRDVFIDKGNPTGNIAANMSLVNLFEECLTYHRSLALEVVLDETKLGMFASYEQGAKDNETNLLKLGIVQRLDDKFHFIHRTVAEYFVADCLLIELQRNSDMEFQRFFIDKLLRKPEFSIVRTFFDNFLQKIEDNTSQKCISLISKNKSNYRTKNYNTILLHVLAGEGHISILQFILNCIDFKRITNKEADITDLFRNLNKEKCGNTLTFLEHLVRLAGINLKDSFGRTPLHCAVAAGHSDMVRFLLEHGAKVDSEDLYITKGNLEIAKLLVEWGANSNTINEDGNALIHLAAHSGWLNIIRFLLDQGAEVDIKNDFGSTALHLAAECGNLEAVMLLVENGAEVDIRNDGDSTPLHLAAEGGHLNTVQFLVQNGADVNSKNDYESVPIYLAAQTGKLDTVKFLVEQGADVNIENQNIPLIHSFAKKHKWSMVKFFVDLGADINIKNRDGNTLLHLASRWGRLDTVKILLQWGADPNMKNDTDEVSTHLAAKIRDLNIIKVLVENGADINASCNGQALLHLFVRKRELDNIKSLLELGADVNLENEDGLSSIHIAAELGDLNTVKLLIDLGADIDISNSNDNTALHSAVRKGHIDIVKYLVEHGADVNSRNKRDLTPMYIAALSSNYHIIGVLAELGADINTKVNTYGSLLHILVDADRLDDVKFLVERGVEVDIRSNKGFTPLHIAAVKGEMETVKYFLSRGANINTRNARGFTPIHTCVGMGKLDCVEFLVEQGADINIKCDNNDNTILHMLAGTRKLDTLKFLVRLGADVNIKNSNGNTVLHLAAQTGNSKNVSFFMDKGVGVDVKNNYDCTPMHLAAQRGWLNILKLLVEGGAEINVRNGGGSTPLHLAAEEGELGSVKFLVRNGAHINITNSHGCTPVNLAAEMGKLETVKFLVESGANVNVGNDKGDTLIHLSAAKGELDVVKLLVEQGADINIKNSSGSTALNLALQWSRLDIVKYLVELDADIHIRSNKGNTPLHLVTTKGKVEIVKLLVERGAKIDIVNDKNLTPLHLAAEKGELDIVKFLIEHGHEVNVSDHHGRTPMDLALRMCQLDTIKHLAERGAEIHTKDSNGNTLLHLFAVRSEFLDTVKYLLERGVDVNVTNNGGNTALHSAAEVGAKGAVEFLVEQGAAVNIRNGFGCTPLHLAAQRGDLDIVKVLVAGNADIDIRNKSGSTPLHLVAERGGLDTVKYFIELGVDINSVNNFGAAPVHLARQEGQSNVGKLLIDHGADVNVGCCNWSLSLTTEGVVTDTDKCSVGYDADYISI